MRLKFEIVVHPLILLIYKIKSDFKTMLAPAKTVSFEAGEFNKQPLQLILNVKKMYLLHVPIGALQKNCL